MKKRNEPIDERDTGQLIPNVESLIDAWCSRRALVPLRILLPAYPLPNGLTDGWGALSEALLDIENLRSDLSGDERDRVRYARRIVQFTLDGR